MKTKMTPEEALNTLDKWRKCTIPMEKHVEAVGAIKKALKEKARQDAIINAIKETIAYETLYPETRIDEEGNMSVVQAVSLRALKDVEERKRKMLRGWILRECLPKEIKALEIIKEKPEFPMYVEMYENAYEMIIDRPGFAVSQSAEELQEEFDLLKEELR